MNKRGALLAVLAMAGARLPAFAQTADKVYRIAVYFNQRAASLAGPIPASVLMRAFVETLSTRGYVEGRNLILDRWSSVGLDVPEREKMMAELVRTKPDVIVVDGTGAALHAAKLTSSIPIVMVASVDPVGYGLAQSLARPGRNVTGLALDVGVGSEEKRFDLFVEMLPKARRLAYVGTKGDWEGAWGKAVQAVAAKRRVDLFFAQGQPSAGFADAIDALKREKSEAFFVALSSSTGPYSQLFAKFALANRLPSSGGTTEWADLGCLMAYGQSAVNFFTHGGMYVDKILKGANPGDLPIEQPTKFELVINLNTAKAIGFTVPQSILLRADRVIQ